MALEKGLLDAVMVPMRVPAGDGFAHMLTREVALVEQAWPIPPVISVQSGKAVANLTRRGKGAIRVGVVMRPCEMRATLELAKLEQVHLENLTLISMDCPGALALRDFSKSPANEISKFERALNEWEERDIRPICQVCDHSNMVSGDLHLGILGKQEDSFPLIANSAKGEALMSALGFDQATETATWEREADKVTERRSLARQSWKVDLKARIEGPDRLLGILSNCINCHNCMRVCPVCYCRQCYFDSEKVKHPADDYLEQAKRKGALRFPPDMLLFHIGRMTHIGLTCVSCGACEDACPASIPISQMFALAADDAQKAFDYVPGRSMRDPQPLVVYKEKEFEEDETHG
jgi:formate dehydrogenase subunit beta